MRHLALFLVLSVGLTACGEGSEDGPLTRPPPTERPDPSPLSTRPDHTTAPPSPDLEELDPADTATVEAAVADLAERTGAAPEDIEVVSFERVTWNDGSLGCPEPGKMYTQALVEGSRTVLELDGATYDYHAGNDRDPFLCEQPRLDPGSGPGES